MSIDLERLRALRLAAQDDDAAEQVTLVRPKFLITILDELDRLQLEVGDLRQSLDAATGPACSSCGNPIDPDWCHCGESHNGHSGDGGHAFTPMGCICGYGNPDWPMLAKSRGELLWRMRRDATQLRAALIEACDVMATDVCTLDTCRDVLCVERRQIIARLRAVAVAP